MKKTSFDYQKTLSNYIKFLKALKIYKKKNEIFYENNIEKLNNWKNTNFKNNLKWYQNIKETNLAKVKTISLNQMNNWIVDLEKGIIKHKSGEFFCIEGKRTLNSNREIKSWDQPFIKQINYKGGIIGLVRAYINNIPHYLVDAKFEPGNYNDIQISPSLQATYSNLNRIHKGEKNKVIKKYFLKNSKTIRKFWVTEDGGRLYKKRNLHWVVQYTGKINVPSKTYRWLTLWEIKEFINKGSLVSPHLRAILSLI